MQHLAVGGVTSTYCNYPPASYLYPMCVHITHRFPPHLRNAAARIYFEAFRQKIGWLLGGEKRAVAFIERVIEPQYAICAIDEDGKLVGLAGFKTAGGAMVGGSFSDLVACYGWISASWRAPLLSLLERKVEPGILLMDGIAVTPNQRGKGTGSRLLEAIALHAKDTGLRSVRLDVIDSNPRAKALYARQGFESTGEENIGVLKYLFGFSRSTTMILNII